MKITIFISLIFLQLTLEAQIIGSFTDVRDGQEYATVTYEFKLGDTTKSTMTWFAENLNFEMESSYCYDDYDSNCEIMGRLYRWPAAIKACPQGWHLPDDEEWYRLANLFGGISFAGIHLKSTSELWERKGQGTNISLFNAMPYGNAVIGNGYYSFKRNTIFWSSSQKDEEYAWDWKIVASWDKIQRWEGHKETIGNSVRCVKN